MAMVGIVPCMIVASVIAWTNIGCEDRVPGDKGNCTTRCLLSCWYHLYSLMQAGPGPFMLAVKRAVKRETIVSHRHS